MRQLQMLLITFLILNHGISQNNFTISAKLTGFPEGTKFYLQDPETQQKTDSAILQNNSIVFRGSLDETPKLLFVSASINKQYYWCNLFIGNEKVTLSADKNDFPFYVSKKGSRSQDMYQVLNDQTKEYDDLRHKLVGAIGALLMDTSVAAKSKCDSTWKAIRPIDLVTDSIRLNFVKKYYNSYAGLNELYYLKEKFSKQAMQTMYNNTDPEYKDSRYGQRISNYLKLGSILKKGDDFADFTAFDTSGKVHQLAAYQGKYILIDFTETNCGPCVYSVKELKKIDSLFKDSLLVISFCADKSKDTWLAGIKRDRPSWLSLSDGKGHYGETVMKYGVTGYPTFFLLDPQGKIIWTDRGYEDGLILNYISSLIKQRNE